jgi:branched-chain amino acid transport system permease protein
MTLLRFLERYRLSVSLVTAAAVLVVLLLLPGTLTGFYTRLVTEMLIWALFAMSLDILLGYTGLPSLGHAAYFGIAAYAVALMNVRYGVGSFYVDLLVGLGMATATALVFGILILRTTHVTFLLITLALAQVLWGLAFRWSSFTGGDNGLTGVAPPDVLGMTITTIDGYYYLVLGFFVVAATVLYLITVSSFGQSLVGIRESPTRMAALGYNIWLHKYMAVVISGFFAGLAGVLMTYHQRFVAPNYLEVATSVKVLLIVMVGGAGTLFGPALGAGVVILLEDQISSRTERWLIVMGSLYVVLVLFARRGIVGEIRNLMQAPERRRAEAGRLEAATADDEETALATSGRTESGG